MIFLEYPKCSTCIKARKWLEKNNIEFIDRDITIENPNVKELTEWIGRSGLDISRFFNTSGLVYKELNLKEKLPTMAMNEKIKLLSTNGKLVKRPLIVTDDFVLVGFKEDEWKDKLLK